MQARFSRLIKQVVLHESEVVKNVILN